MKILYIEASPRAEKSYSSRVAKAFLEACVEHSPGTKVDHLALFETELPRFGREAADQKMAHIASLIESGQGIDAAGEWSGVLEHIARFREADKVVISSSMWNFSIPYPLKHYIDLICQPGLTFGVNAHGDYVGLVRGKPMQLILARGSEYRAGFPEQADGTKTDFQLIYLRHIANFLGFVDVRQILIQPTEARGRDHAEQQLQAQLDAARLAAYEF